MANVQKLEYLSVENYLRMEEQGEVRHEYVHGRVYALVGGTARHNIITTTIAAELRQHLQGKSCTVFMSDMKLRVEDIFYYPDVMVVCGDIDLEGLFQTTPVLLLEVLSKSTESKDRLEKLVAYQNVPSVIEYVLVAQDKISVDIYRRSGKDWELETLGNGDSVTLSSIAYSRPVDVFYADVMGSLTDHEQD